jgi:hypothetical protein
MENVVASLPAAGSGDAGDTGRALSQFGIGYVLLADPAGQSLAGQLNAAAGLQPLTRSSSYDLWQVSGTVARARVVTASGAAVAVPSGPVGVNAKLAPGTSGTLVLAEAAGGWSASLDGKPLTPLAAPVDGWAQGFTLPAGGGHLVITRNETARNLSLAAEVAALFVILVLALPGSRSPVPAPAASRAEGAREPAVPRAEGARQPGDGTRSARRKRRPQFALAGATAGRGARAQDGDDTEAGDLVATGAATADPFGTYGEPEPGPARTPEPALGVARHLDDEDLAPWAGLAPQIPQTPALRDRPDQPPSAPEAPEAPAAPPRRRGAHAARHGKPSRRSRGEG